MFPFSRALTTSPTKTPSGAALVLVLAALALIAFFLIAIMTLVQSEGRGSHTAADLVQVRMLSLLPEKLVISQIRRATGTPDDLPGTGHTWASQPGMIRVFGTTPDSQKPRAEVSALYKLYSARKLRLSAAQEQDADDGPVAEANRLLDWQKNPGEFIDLNEPVRVEPVRSSAKPYFVFPIVDPAAVGLVDGFKIHTSTSDTDGESPPVQANSNTYNPNTDQPKLAMPVTWLYVLQDGSVIAPNRSVTPGVIHFGGSGNASSVPSEGNPIVGRIAYWTDDDSSKLNINTATEPAPWEPPHTHTTTDESYAQSIPAKGEYYRNSGHPAYTSLSPVLRRLGSSASGTITDPPREPANTIGSSEWASHITDWHRWLPRTFQTSGNADQGTLGGTQPANGEVATKQDRLFASVDEMIFTTKAAASGAGREEYQYTTPKLNPEDLNKVRFFLTTHNRAPELNLYNRPKISLWPLMESASARTDIDKKFALASTIGTDIYYFQRQSAWSGPDAAGSSQSQSLDIALTRNAQLLGYLQLLTEYEVPGFGGTFAGTGKPKWTAEGRDQLLISMFDFIRCGVNVNTAYDESTSSTLSPAYRFMPPVLSPSTAGTTAGIGGGSAAPSRFDSDSGGETNPLIDGDKNHTKGFGRFPTITEATLVFMAVDAEPLPPPTTAGPPPPPHAPRVTKIQAFLILEPFNPAPGVMPLAPHFVCLVQGMDQFKMGLNPNQSTKAPLSMGFSKTVITDFTLPPGRAGSGSAPWGGDHSAYVGMSSQFLLPTGDHKEIKLLKPADLNNIYDFRDSFTAVCPPFDLTQLDDVPLDNGLKAHVGMIGTTLYFSGGLVKIEVQDALDQTVQTIEVKFPATDIPVPLMPPIAAGGNPPSQEVLFAARFKVDSPSSPAAPGKSRMPLIMPGDVTRSMVLAGGQPIPSTSHYGSTVYKQAINGDARLLAGRVNPKANNQGSSNECYLIPHPNYFSGEVLPSTITPSAEELEAGRNAQSLRDGAYMANDANNHSDPQAASQLTNQTAGKLAARTVAGSKDSIDYPLNAVPATPVASSGALNADGLAGDFDNGPGMIEDGPYLNFPDTSSQAGQTAAKTSGNGGLFERGGLFVEDDGLNVSPWRQISSAIAFGSLPTGVYGWAGDSTNPPAPRPWQTLLFCPNPASRQTQAGTEPTSDWSTNGPKDHFGFLGPRDHLWLEYFWMPAVEPQGLCDGFSTEGKVNMNYQIVPFFWIKRASAMHGALHGVRVTAIPNAAVKNGDYKDPHASSPSPLEFRYAVDAEKTLSAFDDRFFDPGTKRTDVFRSPSEICEMFLIPKKLANHQYSTDVPDPDSFFSSTHDGYKDALNWWQGTSLTNGFNATGDNLREAPYAQLYPRLCTRSNVFTVHYRVQVLRKSRSTKPELWDENGDKVVAEYRGQSTIERYLDPRVQSNTPANDGSTPATIPDFANEVANDSLDDYYKYRVTNRKRFSP